MIETIAIFIGAAIIVAFWIYAHRLIWRIPVYRDFKTSIEKLEKTKITGIPALELKAPISLKSLGERRVTEVAMVAEPVSDIRLVRLFGAMFLKDETIEGAIHRIQLSCAISAGGILFGLLWIVVGDQTFSSELASKSFAQVVPAVFERLRSTEFVILAELLSFVLGLFAIFDAGKNLKKLDKEAHLDG